MVAYWSCKVFQTRRYLQRPLECHRCEGRRIGDASPFLNRSIWERNEKDPDSIHPVLRKNARFRPNVRVTDCRGPVRLPTCPTSRTWHLADTCVSRVLPQSRGANKRQSYIFRKAPKWLRILSVTSPRRFLALCLFGLGEVFAGLVFAFLQIAPQFLNDALQVLNGRNFMAQQLGQLARDAVG